MKQRRILLAVPTILLCGLLERNARLRDATEPSTAPTEPSAAPTESTGSRGGDNWELGDIGS